MPLQDNLAILVLVGPLPAEIPRDSFKDAKIAKFPTCQPALNRVRLIISSIVRLGSQPHHGHPITRNGTRLRGATRAGWLLPIFGSSPKWGLAKWLGVLVLSLVHFVAIDEFGQLAKVWRIKVTACCDAVLSKAVVVCNHPLHHQGGWSVRKGCFFCVSQFKLSVIRDEFGFVSGCYDRPKRRDAYGALESGRKTLLSQQGNRSNKVARDVSGGFPKIPCFEGRLHRVLTGWWNINARLYDCKPRSIVSLDLPDHLAPLPNHSQEASYRSERKPAIRGELPTLNLHRVIVALCFVVLYVCVHFGEPDLEEAFNERRAAKQRLFYGVRGAALFLFGSAIAAIGLFVFF